jgi:ribosomal protein S18 acetylase RimI-like enzyme
VNEAKHCALVPATDEDRAFLFGLFSLTMRNVIESTWGWNETWQLAEFDRRFAAYEVSTIRSGVERIGGLFLEATPQSLHIHEIQVMPEYQRRGIGTAVMQTIIARARAHELAVTLTVVPANSRAQRFYERLGFRVVSVEAPFIRMQRDH